MLTWSAWRAFGRVVREGGLCWCGCSSLEGGRRWVCRFLGGRLARIGRRAEKGVAQARREEQEGTLTPYPERTTR